MNPIRYIITRNCLQEGSMRLLKYNEGSFPQAGPVQFVDEQGREFAVQVKREEMRVTGLKAFYHDHNLGVNDVMLLTPLSDTRFQVVTVVKPHAITPAASVGASAPASVPRGVPALPIPAPEPQRIVVASTPHVREVRLQRPSSEGVPATSTGTQQSGLPQHALPSQYQQQLGQQLGQPQLEQAAAAPAFQNADTEHENLTQHVPVGLSQSATFQASATQASATQTSATQEVAALFGRQPTTEANRPQSIEDTVTEFAQLTGYDLSHPAPGLMRLKARLGQQHGYSVLLAADPLAMMQPVWDNSEDEAKLVITHEAERPEGVARLTREALSALMDHATLAPLSPLDLRGYWRSGNLDVATAGNIAELVSAHLAQRGAFSFVVMALAQQSANSIISAPQLAEQLGSGVNLAELHTILDTLARPPFLALTPLQGGQYLLRTGMSEMLANLADYATGMGRRVRQPGSQNGAAQPTAQAQLSHEAVYS